jgi:hypothetical protein
MKVTMTKKEREEFRRLGAVGGKTAASNMTPRERAKRASAAGKASAAARKKREELNAGT